MTSQLGSHEWLISLAVLNLKSPSKSNLLFKLNKYIALLLSNFELSISISLYLSGLLKKISAE